ncbi:hypothetical protein R3P38DRAFT_2567130 [Favolaschia claudopus]|uniref:Uncharacterized protein n=1 Tax=Favolaschia claudopus TaxID=2862362 RepID=A0AAV9ZWX1_9AGAR
MPLPPKLWSPQLQLYQDDSRIFSTEPDAQYLLAELGDTLNSPRYLVLLSDWLIFALGAELIDALPQEAIQECQLLFLRVLFLRFQYQGRRDGDIEAKRELDMAQMNLQNYLQPLVRYFVLALDANLIFDNTQDERDFPADSSWEEVIGDAFGPIGGRPSDDTMDLEGNDSDYVPELLQHGDLPTFIEDRPPPRRSSSRQPKAHVQREPAYARVLAWAEHLSAFFSCDVSPVNDLVHMRALKYKEYHDAQFTTGLFKLMRDVAEPGNLLETIHPDVEESFRFHDWKNVYAELICRWVEPTLTQEEYEKSIEFQRPDPAYRFSLDDAGGLLEFISDHPEMQPWGFNPMAVYLFMSLQCFQKIDGWDPAKVYQMMMQLPVFAGDEPALQDLASRSRDARLCTVIQETSDYRIFMRRLRDELYRPSPSPPRPSVSNVDDSSYESDWSSESDTDCDTDFDAATAGAKGSADWVFQGQPGRSQRRKFNKKNSKKRKAASKLAQDRVTQQSIGKSVKRGILGSSYQTPAPVKRTAEVPRGCLHCCNLPPRKRCIWVVFVMRQDWEHLRGHAVTCAVPDDRLPPKPPRQPRDGTEPKPPPPVKYFHPTKDLKWMTIKFRKDVYGRCGQDIVRLVHKHPNGAGEIVGGVRYNPFAKSTLERLIKNHRLVKVRTVRRRGKLHQWLYNGSMTAQGTRKATGGRKGDSYVAYAGHRGDTPADIQALGRMAVSTDALVEVGETICPGLKAEIKGLTEASGVQFLGRTGLTDFTCSNYISPIHTDADYGLSDVIEGRKKKNEQRENLYIYARYSLRSIECGTRNDNSTATHK